MHYKNGRAAKAGDKVVHPAMGIGGILHSLQASSMTCNARLALTSLNDPYVTIGECLHVDDIAAANIPDSTLGKPAGTGLAAIAILLGLLLSLTVARAQTSTNAPPVPVSAQSFFDTATAYFTSFNTNAELGWNMRGEAAAGVASLQGPVNLANDLRLSYEVKGGLGLESSTRSSGIAGTWLSQQLGPCYSFKVYDAKLTLYGSGGYNFLEHDHRYYGELGVRVSKKMTRYTFAGVGLGAQIPTGRQVFTAFAGFTF